MSAQAARSSREVMAPDAVAIVGRACVLPGALDPAALAAVALAGETRISSAPDGRWRLARERVLAPSGGAGGDAGTADRALSDRGGYVAGFEGVFDAGGFALPAERIERLDVVVRWLLHAGREALRDAGASGVLERAGAIVGNLSYPSAALARRAERQWLGARADEAGIAPVPAEDRFMSGLPVHLLAQALGLGGASFAIDAACASSLYAIRLACDRLRSGQADLMLAGGINAADDLFLHVGFTALGALSPSGRSLPLRAGGDGLLPGEGVALVVLERLADALRNGRRILGIVRGVGLSNDGRGRGLLAPLASGQERAVRAAYAESGVTPERVSLVECHATGTPVGDATEIESLAAVFTGALAASGAEAGRDGIAVGSLKANLGHLVTGAGAAGLLKVLAALEAGVLPPSGGEGAPHPALARSPFRLVEKPEPWPRLDQPRVAAVSAFGFGGNNAHLLVEEWESRPARVAVPAPANGSAPGTSAGASAARPALAIVGMGARVADLTSVPELCRALFHGESRLREVVGLGRAASAAQVELPLAQLRFPPADLEQALPQQTLLLAATLEAVSGIARATPERTGVLVGMGCDAEVARYGARWRAAEWLAGTEPEALRAIREQVIGVLRAPGVVGAMPNIPANRLNSQLDARGPGYTVSAEELSGIRALELAREALESGALDLVVVGAVDLSAEPVHARAAAELLPPARSTPGDAAVVLVLRRLDDAVAAGEPVIAVLPPAAQTEGAEEAEGAARDARLELRLGPGDDADSSLTPLFGHAHAASGLLHVAAAALCLGHRALPGSAGRARAWSLLAGAAPAPREARVVVHALGGAHATVLLREHVGAGRESGPEAAREGTDPVELAARLDAARPAPVASDAGSLLRLPAHAPHVAFPGLDASTAHAERMAAAPRLPSAQRRGAPRPQAPAPQLPQPQAPSPSRPPQTALAVAPPPAREPAPGSVASAALAAIPAAATRTAPPLPPALPLPAAAPAGELRDAVLARIAAQQGQAAAMHRDFLATQHEMHARFLELRGRALGALTGADADALPGPAHRPAATPRPGGTAVVRSGARPPAPRIARATTPARAPSRPAEAVRPAAASAQAHATPDAEGWREPLGPTFDRAALEVHAGGRISTLFGPQFAAQDANQVQVRMPEPPLLLADRVVGIDAAPASLGLGTVWTETDVRADAWYLNQGYVPAGVLIEAGQADLFLISYLGIDLELTAEREAGGPDAAGRAYRLLGCELTYEGPLPSPGETVRYQIEVDGHASQGSVRLFFFHYQCRGRDGRPVLRVRGGQAGFFTREELRESGGVLWSAEEAEPRAGARLDPPLVAAVPRALEAEALRAFSEGDAFACFGPGYERARAHVRTPRVQSGRMLLMDRVATLDPEGGPWRRGYLKATLALHPDAWFFSGHFKNDPCMPGTLMFEGCLQAMSIYLAALGYTLERDGWRFEPVTGEPFKLLCRGQAIPSSRELVYELFVEEVHDGPLPTLVADLLCTVDGLKAFHARRLALRLVPDWPLSSRPGLVPAPGEEEAAGHTVALVDGFRFGYGSLLACAWGRPSDAFGPMYAPFDGTRRVARLPGPPYHFMSRVREVEGPIGVLRPGAEVVIEYDVPEDAWYFDQNGCRTMPFAVLLEAVLQPCGWLASYVGSALSVPTDLMFRNLDGSGVVHAEVTPEMGTIETRVRITAVSPSAGIIIESFDVDCRAGGRSVFTLKTVFGFFPKEALENQVGLPTTPEERARLERPSEFEVDLRGRPERYFSGSLRLAGPMLCMLDRITDFEAAGGGAGLGWLRAEKTVDASEWFFKAHFFQDPVQPGSLGIEAMLQLLQFYLLETGAGDGIPGARFQPIAIGDDVKWKYRGQVQPRNRTITTTLEVTSAGRDERSAWAVGNASLWVDGRRIYEAAGLGMRIVAGAPEGTGERSAPGARGVGSSSAPAGATGSSGARVDAAGSDAPRAGATAAAIDDTLDPAVDRWLQDHRPTFTAPALPMMSVVDRLLAAASAAAGEGATLLGLEDVRLTRWIAFPGGPQRLRAEASWEGEGDARRLVTRLLAFREARDPRLSRLEPVATARALLGPAGAPPAAATAAEGFAPLEDGREAEDPYASGALFHGTAFHLLRTLRLGRGGASATLDAGAGSVPRGFWHQALLDAATHAIPHDRLYLWSDAIGDDVVAYPHRVARITVHAPAPASGPVRCEVRFDGFDGDPRLPRFHVQLLDGARLLVDLALVEVLLPKGPLGRAEPRARTVFLRDRVHVKGVSLSRFEDGVTRLASGDVIGSDWYPGTIAGVYAVAPGEPELDVAVAVKEHLGRRLSVHPSQVTVRPDAAPAPPPPRQPSWRGPGPARPAWTPAAAVAATLPLTLHPVAVAREGDGVTVRDAGPARLDTDRIHEFWRARLGVDAPLVEDLHRALLVRFLRRVVVPEPGRHAELHGRSVLYLANHQVGIESPLFSIAIAAVTGVSTSAIAKAEHRESWLGRLIAHAFAYPGATGRAPIVYFDRDDPGSMPRLLEELGAEMSSGALGLLVHVEGTRALSCGPPVTRMSGALLDLALRAEVLVVPVRFQGGLPVEPAAERLDFPYGMGQQDYVLGRPIAPAELAPLTYRERQEAVLAEMNATGMPPAAREQPLGGDPALAAAAAAWVERTGAGRAHATLLAALGTLADPSPATVALLEGARTGELRVSADALGRWTAELARRLYGPRGPRIVTG